MTTYKSEEETVNKEERERHIKENHLREGGHYKLISNKVISGSAIVRIVGLREHYIDIEFAHRGKTQLDRLPYTSCLFPCQHNL